MVERRDFQNAQIKEFIQKGVLEDNFFEADFFENKKISEEDFNETIVTLLKRGIDIPQIKEIQSCYHNDY